MVTLSPRVTRLRANNPSPLTLDGTNGYVVRVGPRELVAIDPGPVDRSAAPPVKGGFVHRNRLAVEFDGAFDGGSRQRQCS